MTALTMNKQRPVQYPNGGLAFQSQPLQGYTNYGSAYTAYHGAIMGIDATDASGYVQPAAGFTPTTGDIFAGIASERQDVTANETSDGAKVISVIKNGVWGFAVGSLTQANVGSKAYAHDDDSVDATSSSGLYIGEIVAIDSTYVWVDIAPAFMVAT